MAKDQKNRPALASMAPCRPAAALVALVLVSPASSYGQTTPDADGAGAAAACHIDLTADGAVDTVVLFQREGRHRLVAMIADGNGYAAHMLGEYGPSAFGVLSCRQGARLASTTAGAGQRAPTVHTTPGAYVSLSFPESSEVAYYWRDGAFVEVWLGD